MFSLVHIIAAAASFSVRARLERGDVLSCVHRGGTVQKNNPCTLPCTQSKWVSFKFAEEFAIQPRYVPTLVQISSFRFRVSVLSVLLGEVSKGKRVMTS